MVLHMLMYLAEISASDSIIFQTAKDLLDRAGFLPIDRIEEKQGLVALQK